MPRAVLEILEAGPQCSVQDGGRAGLMRFGVPQSGAMDRVALAVAQAAAGQPAGAGVMEVSLGGLALRVVEGRLSFAVAGGGFIVRAGAVRSGSWSVVTLQEGDDLIIERGRWGAWCILAPAGLLQAGQWLGSAATHALSGLGGGAIRAGQHWVVEDARTLPDRPLTCPVWARPRGEVAVVIGPQERHFPPERIDMLLHATFRLTDAYDRMGVRLRGPSLAPADALAIPSEPVLRGAVQVSGDGTATILLADHQTTGGYPKIATVIGPELDALVQSRPHAALAFRAVTPDQAIGLARTRATALARVLAAYT